MSVCAISYEQILILLFFFFFFLRVFLKVTWHNKETMYHLPGSVVLFLSPLYFLISIKDFQGIRVILAPQG